MLTSCYDAVMNAPITLETLRRMKQTGEKIACLTVYDASFASVLDQAGVDVLLVGDSLGMVIQGQSTTLPVTVDEMVYHSRCVRRGNTRSLLLVDMPFLADGSPELALTNAARLMKEGGAQVIKLEGGEVMLPLVEMLSQRGVPVCAHLGLLPQSVHKLGGYRLQGRDEASAQRILQDALAMEQAGADLVLLECVPASLAASITERLSIPVIGIGAGPACDAQVLVLYDMLGITPGKRPRFSHDFLQGCNEGVQQAVAAYVNAVKQGHFPADQHCYI